MKTASARIVIVVAALAVAVLVVLVLVNRSPAQETADGPAEPQPVELITPSAPGDSAEPTPEASASASPEESPTPAKVPDPSEISPKGLTAEELVITAAETMTTWAAAEDRSETDAYRRALPLFVDEYKDIFVAPERPTVPTEWREAAKHEAISVPEVEVMGSSKQGEATNFQVVVTWAWTDNDGWELSAGPKYMEFQVTPDGKNFIIENWSENGLQ